MNEIGWPSILACGLCAGALVLFALCPFLLSSHISRREEQQHERAVLGARDPASPHAGVVGTQGGSPRSRGQAALSPLDRGNGSVPPVPPRNTV